MERVVTLFLKLVLILVGIFVLAADIVGLVPAIIQEESGVTKIFLSGVVLSTIPFLVALFHSVNILSEVSEGKVFTIRSLNGLKYIKYCATLVAALYLALMPIFYLIAKMEDAPGVIVIGLGLVFIATVFAMAAELFQRLLQSAINSKAEAK